MQGGGRRGLSTRRGGNRRQPTRMERREQGAQGVELLVEGAVLADRRIRVVARHGRLQHPVVIRTVPEPEVRAAMSHVQTDRSAGSQELVDGPPGAGGGSHMVPLTPMIEPSAPQLAAHERIATAAQ